MSALKLLLAGLLLPLFACAGPDTNVTQTTMRTLASGAFSGITEAKQEVIRDQTAWKEFWTKHATQQTPAEAAPQVDFSKEMVLAVTLGRKRSGGYAVKVADVKVDGDKLVVKVAEAIPQKGGMTIQSLTSPFHFVAVTRSDKKVEFTSTRLAKPRRPFR